MNKLLWRAAKQLLAAGLVIGMIASVVSFYRRHHALSFSALEPLRSGAVQVQSLDSDQEMQSVKATTADKNKNLKLPGDGAKALARVADDSKHDALPERTVQAKSDIPPEPAAGDKAKLGVDSNHAVVRGVDPLAHRVTQDDSPAAPHPAAESQLSSLSQGTNTLLRKPQQAYDYIYDPVRPSLWFDPAHADDDRIISQMTYKPQPNPVRMKNILVMTGLRDGMMHGSQSFVNQKCPVTECSLTDSSGDATQADVILWQDHVYEPSTLRPANQIWMIFLLESPFHTPPLSHMNGRVNWTATYRRDSTIVAPYERFTPFDYKVSQLPLAKNYASGKTKKVAWFVSNCGARNNRLEYAKELGQHIEVDIYGACGSKECPRSRNDHCYSILSQDYKFYLAFENSNCRDYITEKFLVTGLQNDVLPIVMGAHPEDYRRAAPPHSYIHVDDFESPQELAKYLLELDSDDSKYNEYFRWKGTGYNINTYFWCRVCAMAHAADFAPPTVYEDLEGWWRGPQVCKERTSERIWPKW